MSLVLAATVLLHATLLDGTGGPPLRDSCLEIVDGRIARVTTASECAAAADNAERVVDVTGRWIVPGLIDAHTHLFDSGSLYTSPDDFDLTARVPHEEERARIREGIDETLERYLCSGVTTVASLGGPRWELELRERTAAPRVMTAGPFYAGFPVGAMTLWTEDDPVLVQVETPAEARAAVEMLDRRGADLVKAGFVSPEVLETLVAEAHARGLKVALHAEELEAAREAVAAGVDVLAHTVVDEAVDEAFLDAAKASGVVSITGLSHFSRYRDVLRGSVSLLPVEERCGDPRVIATWDDVGAIAIPPPMPDSIRWGASDEARRVLLDNVRLLHEASIPVAAGSNGGNIGTLQGPSFHRELAMLAEAGFSPSDVLVAATRDAARALGVEEHRGTLEPGKAGDLVVLSEDPLADVAHLSSVERVFVAGAPVYPPEVSRIPAEPMSYRGAYWLERDDRFDEERPDRVLETLDFRPGDVVADIGTGSGYYARKIAPRVQPGGTVYAVDIQPEMLVLLRRLLEEEGVEGVVPVLGHADDPKLPEGEVDWILLADVYHEIASPETMLAAMRLALAPSGRVALIEYRVEDGSGDHVKADHAMSVRQVLSEWLPAGFSLLALHELLPTQHLFVFGKDTSPRRGLEAHDLDAAVASGWVEIDEIATEADELRLRIRRARPEPLVVTLAAGSRLEGHVARRDAAILLDESVEDWTIRALDLEDLDTAVEPLVLRRLMQVIQRGTFFVDGEVAYPPRTVGVERAALSLAFRDWSYPELAKAIDDRRLPDAYVAAFALVFCELAGIEPTRLRIWRDATRIFQEATQYRDLTRWYDARR